MYLEIKIGAIENNFISLSITGYSGAQKMIPCAKKRTLCKKKSLGEINLFVKKINIFCG